MDPYSIYQPNYSIFTIPIYWAIAATVFYSWHYLKYKSENEIGSRKDATKLSDFHLPTWKKLELEFRYLMDEFPLFIAAVILSNMAVIAPVYVHRWLICYIVLRTTYSFVYFHKLSKDKRKKHEVGQGSHVQKAPAAGSKTEGDNPAVLLDEKNRERERKVENWLWKQLSSWTSFNVAIFYVLTQAPLLYLIYLSAVELIDTRIVIV